MKFAAVAIGRNEGDRLKGCLQSLSAASVIVYVDSGSTDSSLRWASEAGAQLVMLDLKSPFTAARARNEGFRKLMPAEIEFVQFIDGDCEMATSWPQQAISFLQDHPDVAAVAGRRRERFPSRSIYNWLCDFEWSGSAGEASAFGGDVMIRAGAFEGVGGYRETMIAGEEPELCVRLRAAGWRIWRLDAEMTLHDAAMTRFSQWWRRNLRAGYAYALGASLHGQPPMCHKVREVRRAWAWGVGLPLAAAVLTIGFGAWGALALALYPLQVLRLTVRRSGPLKNRFAIAFFQTLARFPEALGQMMFVRDQLLRRRPGLIEYK